jgi:hypothetical protein
MQILPGSCLASALLLNLLVVCCLRYDVTHMHVMRQDIAWSSAACLPMGASAVGRVGFGAPMSLVCFLSCLCCHARSAGRPVLVFGAVVPV